MFGLFGIPYVYEFFRRFVAPLITAPKYRYLVEAQHQYSVDVEHIVEIETKPVFTVAAFHQCIAVEDGVYTV